MQLEIPDAHLSRLSEFVAEATGLHFPPARWPDLQRGIAAAASELGFDDVAACARSLLAGPWKKEQIEALAGHLTVGETYFFRERNSFDVFSTHLLPKLMHDRQGRERRLRIWSAACCTGEEPYSIAILLRQTIPDLADWNITLLATDINPRFLRKAAAGVFGQWSFRDAPAGIKERCFHPTPDGRFEILPEIKRMVHFAPLNLAEDVYPSLANDTNAMDVIFCRNVLMYFTAAGAKKVIANLHRAQIDGGFLFVSPSELPHVSSTPFVTVNIGGATIYQKRDDAPRPPPTAPFTFQTSPEELFIPIALPTIARKAESSVAVAPPEDLYKIAIVLYQQGRYAEAADRLRDIKPDRAQAPAVFGLLARSLANQGKLDEALASCDRWIAADKLSATGQYLRAVILQEQGRTDEAIRSLRAALYADPKVVLAHFALGNIARDRGRAPESEKHFENALRLLRDLPPDEVVPESEGVTAGRLGEIITSLIGVEATV